MTFVEIVQLVLIVELIALALFPVVSVLGSTLINVYFNRLEKHILRMAYLTSGINPDKKNEVKKDEH